MRLQGADCSLRDRVSTAVSRLVQWLCLHSGDYTAAPGFSGQSCRG